MKSVGIVCEYNPFHNGHIYHINKVKELYKDYTIILVLSGNFTQRGDVSLINKWKKTEIALNYVDLVIELPFVFAVQSADIFAKGAVDMLNALNVEAIIFGSECDDVEKLEKLAQIQETEEYNLKVKNYLGKGFNYPSSMSKAFKDICNTTVDKPNDLLGLSYIKNINKTKIKAVTIKRTNDYLDKNLTNDISSASSIREALKNKRNIKRYVPEESYRYLDNPKFTNDYFELLKYKIITEDISKYLSVDEGIENRIKSVINEANSIDELIEKLKSKRYTYNKIKRMLTHILTGFTKKEANTYNNIQYIRVLGFNKNGQNYLNKIKKECSIPIITKYKKNIPMLSVESRVTNVYNLKKKDDFLEEYQRKPIIH